MLVAALASWPAPAQGQAGGPAFVARAWTVADGLPSNAVTDARQGADGYLWITTYAGLARFDGVRFTVFTSETTPALPTDRLLGVAPSHGGAFWIRTETLAIVRFDPARMAFARYDAGLEGAQTRVVHEDADGTVWVGTDAGLFRWQGRRFVRVRGLVANVYALVRDHAGALWIGTGDNGLFRLRNGHLRHFTDTAGTDSLSAGWATTLIEDADGNIWAGTPERLFRYAGGRFVPGGRPRPRPGAWDHGGHDVLYGGQPVFTAGSDVLSAAGDHEGNGWVATKSDGLVRLKPALFSVYSEAEGLGSRYVYSVLEDRAGAIWAGTAAGGLNRLHGGTVEAFRKPVLPSDEVLTAAADDRGQLWVGHDRGVCRFTVRACVPLAELGQVPVQAILPDRHGALWVANARRLCRWTEGAAPRCLGPADGLPDADIRTMRATPDGALWIGTEAGLVRLKDGHVRIFTTTDGLTGPVVRSLLVSADGTLWAGTGGRGLNQIMHPGSEHPRIRSVRAADGLPDDIVYALVEDGRGRLWMSTNRGIAWVTRASLDAFLDGRAPRVYATLYTEADGLRNREGNGSQQAALRARDGRLWFATQDGIVVVDPAAVRLSVPVPVRVEAIAAGGRVWRVAAGAARLGARQRSFEVSYTALAFTAPETVAFRYRLDGFDAGWIEGGTRRTAFYTNIPPGRYTFRVMARDRDGRWAQAAPLALSVAPFLYETWGFRALVGLLLVGLVWGTVSWRTRALRRRERALGRAVARRTRDLTQRTRDLTAANAVVSEHAERLREMDAAKNRLFANLSHEFRTPLTLILGPLQSGIDGAYGPVPDALRSRDTLMLRNGRRLMRLVNQVLDLARLEAGGLTLHPAPHDLPTFVRQTALAFAPLAERQQIALAVDVAGAPAVAVFDREQMERVLGNLLSNALKFTPAGGAVRVECRRAAGTASGDGAPAQAVEIVVSDTGIGIAPDDLARVFDRFFQVDASATRAHEGSGIGLALARELVERHGGTLTAESDTGGPDAGPDVGPSGSRFTVRLPLADAPRPAAELALALPEAPPAVSPALDAAVPDTELPEPPAADSADDRTTVLVVDDNADLRAYLRQILEADYRVVEAADGAKALALARAALPDLVVADVMMPVMDGLAFTRALRDDPETDVIPVVLLTARSETADELAGLETGADDYVTKPFLPELLRTRVANLIALRQRLHARLRTDGTPTAEPAAASPPEPPFTAAVRAAILAHLTDGAFTVEALAGEVALSYSQLNRRLTAEAGISPLEFVRRVRLDAAARLLEDGAGTVSEVAYAVGFNSLAHFSRAFRAQFGTPPSAYAKASR